MDFFSLPIPLPAFPGDAMVLPVFYAPFLRDRAPAHFFHLKE